MRDNWRITASAAKQFAEKGMRGVRGGTPAKRSRLLCWQRHGRPTSVGRNPSITHCGMSE